MKYRYYIPTSKIFSTMKKTMQTVATSVADFTKPSVERTLFSKGRSFLFLWEGHLKIEFLKTSFNFFYQRLP